MKKLRIIALLLLAVALALPLSGCGKKDKGDSAADSVEVASNAIGAGREDIVALDAPGDEAASGVAEDSGDPAAQGEDLSSAGEEAYPGEEPYAGEDPYDSEEFFSNGRYYAEEDYPEEESDSGEASYSDEYSDSEEESSEEERTPSIEESLPPESELTRIYQESYDYTMEHLNEIIVQYWEDPASKDSMTEALRGTIEGLVSTVREVDPGLLDSVSDEVALRYADGPLGAHLIEKGMDTFFSDSQLGRDMRSLSEAIIGGVLDFVSAVSSSNELPANTLVFCEGNMEYALLKSSGTIGQILDQIREESGYTAAMEALQYYYDIINSEFESDTMELWQQLDYFDGNVEALQTSCRSLDGRMDAIKAGMDAWDASLKKWEDSFLSGFPALKDVESKGGLGSCLYLIYDKNDNIVSSFIGSDNEFFTNRLEFLNITNTGICSFVHNKTFYAFDRNGTKLYEGTYAPSEEEWYHFTGTVTLIDGFYDPAPCGNILRKTTRDSFDSGKYEVLELVHPDGSAEDLISGYQLGVSAYDPAEYDYGYVANGVKNGWSWSTDSSSDFWKVSYFPLDSKDVLTRYIDMQTGDLYTKKEFQPIAEKAVFDGDDQYVAINDRYMLDNKTFDLVEIANPENVVANFSAGNGLHRLFYDEFNKLYWAVSGTGYYYVLDENFQQILDPRKPDNSWYILTPYGFVHASGDEYGLFDSKDNLLCSLPNGKAVGFVMSGEEYCVNMYTHKKICLQVTQ